MRGLLREPLLHFLLAGSLLFVVYTWLNRDGGDTPRVVHITAADVNWLRETWARQWSRPPDENELRSLVAGHLKEKLLVREARELGLELDDTVVRRRLAQKMEFLVQDAASLTEPGDAELRRLYKKNIADYRSPTQISFTQIYFRNKADALRGLDKRFPYRPPGRCANAGTGFAVVCCRPRQLPRACGPGQGDCRESTFIEAYLFALCRS